MVKKKLECKDSYTIKEFKNEDKSDWDNFILKSRNGTFLHQIDYLHYHKDRFTDCSLVIRINNKIVAVLPGNIEGDIFYSHKGLTYGGLITEPSAKISDILNYFSLINGYLLINKNITKVIYKTIPYIYHELPSQEDEYALFKMGARWIGSGIASVIDFSNRLSFSKSRSSGIKKALKYELNLRVDDSFADFWEVLSNNLEITHQTKPVHNLQEIMNLKATFDENIKLYTVYEEDKCIAGAVIYSTQYVAHVQYISANERGKQVSALDFLFDILITNIYKEKKYFDFGTSTEANGLKLNEGLAFQKQGFGARAVVYNQYEYNLNKGS